MTADDVTLTAGPQPENDHSDFLLSTGFRYFSKEGLSITFAYDKRFGREDFDEDTFTLNARWDY